MNLIFFLKLCVGHPLTYLQVKQQFREMKKFSSTDGRFKELRIATRKAQPPMIPYLGIVLNEIAGLVEVQPTVLENNLVNFSKMRRVRETEIWSIDCNVMFS